MRTKNEPGKTLTFTKGQGIARRPEQLISSDYGQQEYGLSETEMVEVEKQIAREVKAAHARGEVTPFTGSKNAFD